MAAPERTRGSDGGASLESNLLDRLERQVAELTELKGRLQSLQSALEAERKARAEMASRLSAERERAKKLEGQLGSLGTDEKEVARLREALARERQSALALGSQLEQAWTQLNTLKAAQGRGRRPFRRKR
jgi:predicted  nucleic acid-binding Zn-ribbon protein